MDSKLHNLLEAAVSKTEAGKLDWLVFDDESFRTKIGSGFLHIQRGTTELSSDGETFSPYDTYTIQISDSQGRVVAEAQAVQNRDDARLCNRLFEAARKSALKSDHVIDDMLRTLQGSAKA